MVVEIPARLAIALEFSGLRLFEEMPRPLEGPKHIQFFFIVCESSAPNEHTVLVSSRALYCPAVYQRQPVPSPLMARQPSNSAPKMATSKLAAIQKLVAPAIPRAIPLLKALQDDTLVLVKGRLAIVDGSGAKDALSGEPMVAPADTTRSDHDQ